MFNAIICICNWCLWLYCFIRGLANIYFLVSWRASVFPDYWGSFTLCYSWWISMKVQFMSYSILQLILLRKICLLQYTKVVCICYSTITSIRSFVYPVVSASSIIMWIMRFSIMCCGWVWDSLINFVAKNPLLVYSDFSIVQFYCFHLN